MTSLLKISVGFWGKHEDAPPDALSMRKLLTKCRVQSAMAAVIPSESAQVLKSPHLYLVTKQSRCGKAPSF